MKPRLTRRNFIARSGALALGCGLDSIAGMPVVGAAARNHSYGEDFPDMLLGCLSRSSTPE